MAKSVKRDFGLGGLEDYAIKKLDAQQRLARQFAVFINTDEGGMFISGGEEPPVVFDNENFKAILIAASLRESDVALNVLREAGADTRQLYDEQDFYAEIGVEYLSRYLAEELGDLRTPVATAAEYIAVDMISDRISRVFCSGDYALDDPGETKENYFFVGLHRKSNEIAIKTELEKNKIRELLRNPNPAGVAKQINKLAEILRKKFKFKYVNFIV